MHRSHLTALAVCACLLSLLPLAAVGQAASVCPTGLEPDTSTANNSTPPLRPQWSPPVQVASAPRIYVADNLFTKEECEELISLGLQNGMREAGIMGGDAGKKDNAARRSRRSLTTTLGVHGKDGAEGNEVVAMWRERMSRVALLPESHAEALAVTQYVGGDNHKYELHFDSSLQVGRVATVLVFLRDVHDGGELLFPWANGITGELPEGVSGTGRDIMELEGVNKEPPIAPYCADGDETSVKIAPRVGRAAIFFTHMPDLRREGYRAMHAGCPPRKKGEDKWIAQLFIKWHDANGANALAQIMQAVNQPWRAELLQ